jgi:hypothetical protein
MLRKNKILKPGNRVVRLFAVTAVFIIVVSSASAQIPASIQTANKVESSRRVGI